MQAILRYPCVRPLCLLSAAVLLWFGPNARAADTGTISGTVSNSATGNLLEGAKVEIPELGLSTLTDQTGRFILSGVSAGTHELVASYVGLDAARQTTRAEAGARAIAAFDLNSSVYKLDSFVVAGVREGGAAAITAQRNAANVKNVVAMDSFGNLPNMSAGELAIRLPGVAGVPDDEGVINGIIVRGFGPTLNTVTVDGGLIANSAGVLGRQFQMVSISGAMFDQLEVVKGHTPDQSAASMGGTVNLKSRSTLSMKEKRRFNYGFSARWAPTFTEQIPLRRDHPLHPLLNASYQEVFDVFGGQRNLGIAVTTFYSENVNASFRSVRDFENTTNQPAYLYRYTTQDYFNNRKTTGVNVKTDYRVSPSTKISLNTIYSDQIDLFNRLYEVVAATSQSTAPTGGIIDYTDKITRVRAVPASTLSVTETMFSFKNRTRAVDLRGEHEFGRLQMDWTGSYSQAHVNLGVGGGGTLTNTITGVGWDLDRTQSDLYPKFTQTGGPDIRNIANYQPGQLNARDNTRSSEVTNFRGNARYSLPTRLPATLKAGFDRREQRAGLATRDRRWNYAGGARPLAVDPSIVTWDSVKTGRQIPMFETAALIKDYVPVDAALWSEDRYFRESQRYINTREVNELVTAGYGLAQGKAGRFGFLGGARVERTEVAGSGWVRARTLSAAAQQLADPVGAAQRDYANNARTVNGDYTDLFPSAHAFYDIMTNLKARLSWSTSFGRPPFGNLVPGETPNETNRTLTVNNPSLKPQHAKNWDATLEYYFEPVGQFAIGWFHKSITDYIVGGTDGGIVAAGQDNGFGGNYEGFQILQTGNLGSAFVQGWEVSYQQQFTFLPGAFRGLGVAANYTYLKTWGRFAGNTYIGNNQVAGFVPETGNLSLTYKYRKFNTRTSVNYTGRFISGFTAPGSPRNLYRYSRTVVNLSLAYDWHPRVAFTCDIANVFNEPQRQFRYLDTQMERTVSTGVAVNLGVTGRV